MKINVICNYCGKEFLREKSLKTIHCSKKCAAYTRNKKNHIKIICKFCGKEFTKKTSNKAVHCSRKCAATVSSNNMRLTNVSQYFKEQGCELLEKYKNTDTPVAYRCSCGNIGKVRFSHFKKGMYCDKCSSKKKPTFEEVEKHFEEQGCKLLETEYESNSKKIKYKCKCGRIANTMWCNFKRGARCKQCGYDKITGPNNSRYDPNLTDEERGEHRIHNPVYKRWRQIVYQRDNYTCRKCKKKGVVINAHHIKNYSTFSEGRFDPNNGITLCNKCHKYFHHKYGNAKNNEQQLKEYLSA